MTGSIRHTGACFSRKICALSLIAAAGLCLGACGDGVGQPIREAVITPTDTSGGGNDGVPSSSYCQDVATWSESDAASEEQLLGALDAVGLFGLGCDSSGLGMWPPAQNPSQSVRASLSRSPELRCSARHHARDMSGRGYFSQVTPEGETPATRMQLAGYSSSLLLEVIARDSMLQELLGSGGEGCQALGDPNVIAIGVGKFENFWTLDFGGARAP